MRTNGYGSVEQVIVIHVPREAAELTASKLGIVPFKEAGTPSRSYFLWKRWSIKKGNDEDVVYEIDMILGDAEHKLDWKIDWDASEY